MVSTVSIDLEQLDKVLEEYDLVIAPSLSPNNLSGLLDASSMLWRLNVSIIYIHVLVEPLYNGHFQPE